MICEKQQLMRYVGRRHCLADASPLRSMPLYRTVESVFGPSPQVKAEADLRIARAAFVAEMKLYAAARAALGTANCGPVNWQGGKAGCRRYHQAEAMRTLNARRAIIRAVEHRLQAAEAAVAAMTPVDAYANQFLAKMAGVHALQVAA